MKQKKHTERRTKNVKTKGKEKRKMEGGGKKGVAEEVISSS